MKIKKISAVSLALILLFSALFGCAPKSKSYSRSWFEWFDTFSTLTVYAESQQEFDAYAELCASMLKEYHELLDKYHAYDGINNLKLVNDHAGKGSLEIDPKLGEFLQFGKEIHTLTKGYTNIAMGSVLNHWHNARELANADPQNARLPDEEALQEAKQHTNIEHLILSDDLCTVELTDPLMSIDAGAIGKGYVAQKIMEALRNNGCASFLLNLGGNVVSYGTKPDGAPWQVAIENPTKGKGLEQPVQLPSGMSLVTSGSYQRYFTVNGTKYHHIIHPVTARPEVYCTSVSVLCDHSGLADALSTALFCMTVEDGIKLLAEFDGAEAIWLFEDGSIKTTDRFTFYVSKGDAR